MPGGPRCRCGAARGRGRGGRAFDRRKVKEAARHGGLTALVVRRPILAFVFSTLIVVAGLAAYFGVDVRELPDVDRPVITVRTQYDGAAPETMDREVTQTIEGAVARVAGVDSISSSSSLGRSDVTVEFSQKTDLNVAAADTRDSISRVRNDLPDGIDEPRIIKADANAQAVMRLAVTSDTMAVDDLTVLVNDVISDRLAAVPGVADVQVYGDAAKVFRIDVDQNRLASRGLTVADLSNALSTAAFDVPAGTLTSNTQDLVVRATAELRTPADFERLVIAKNVRLGDVATVTLGPETGTTALRANGHSGVGLGIVRQAASNTLDISKGVYEAVRDLRPILPKGVNIRVTSDDSVFINGAIHEVVRSLLIAVIAVVVIIFLFLLDWRATLIPSLTLPVALIGTVAADLSRRLLDQHPDPARDRARDRPRRRRRHRRAREHRAPPRTGARAARRRGARHAGGLLRRRRDHRDAGRRLRAAVVPAGPGGRAVPRVRLHARLLGGAVGLRRADALPDARLAHAHRAQPPPRRSPRPPRRPRRRPLPPLPALGARGALRRRGDRPRLLGRRLRRLRLDPPGADAARGPGGRADARSRAAGRQPAIHPEPDEADRGRRAADGAGTARSGTSSRSAASATPPTAASWSSRWRPGTSAARSQDEIVRDIQAAAGRVPSVRAFAIQPNSLGIRGAGNGLQFAVVGNDYDQLSKEAADIMHAMEKDRGFGQVRLDYETTQPQLSVSIDREKASDLGINITGLGTALQAMVDQRKVGTVFVKGKSYDVDLVSSTTPINDPTDLENIFIKTARRPHGADVVDRDAEGDGDRAGSEPRGPAALRRRDGKPDAGPGARRRLSEGPAIAARYLKAGDHIIPLAEAKTLRENSHGVAVTFAFAITVIFLVLSAQFESFLSAVIVMATVPVGLACAVYALILTGGSINVYSQIGLVLLVGIMAKNGILIVEFANQLRDRGYSVRKAIEESANIRLRPVLMTMIATILGGMPLVLASGAGAEARSALGWVIVGGLGLAAVSTLFLTPVAYLLLAGFSKPKSSEEARLRSASSAAAASIDTARGAPAE